MDNALKATRLQELMEQINTYQTITLKAMVEVGARWKEIRDNKLFTGKSFREFCEKETPFSHTSVYSWIKLEEIYGPLIRKGAIEASPTRLIQSLPHVKADDAEEWIHKAKTLNKEDFENELLESKGKTPTDKCNHDDCEEWRRCRICGKFLK